MDLTGSTILITGGTSGIGLALALRLHDAGNTVIVAGRRRSLLDAITAEHPGLHAIELDIADPESIARARASIELTHPGLNVVVNNAGIMLMEDLLDPSDVGIAEQHVQINLLGTIRMVYAFAPVLAGKEGAAILTVSSALAFVPWAATPTYSATKAALHSFTESSRIALAGAGVQVVEIVPPAVRTALLGQEDSQQAMPLDEYVSEVLALLRENPDARELVVENARWAREAAANGTYAGLVSSLSSL
ncbi:SDR family oxidoreductase [Rathayibacter sp. VKM Ac-2630]|uniref:SDR family oxidoreductase n=1 Tax=Rathayibacter sp. VKM Ac-2630 TaxID=1938617 RepID=UPI000981E20B|nr:SDR family NAD(P)-dependent oxidoreductase [Rathayibacter sp. VKM Ac-2630]OOB90885.1 oxidoreductase [Rathayibacter sp. VKM Ac-2630]